MGFNPFGNLPVINMADIASKADIDDINQRIKTEDLSLYIDPTNGDDSTADGSYNKPYKTFIALFNSLPKYLDSLTVTIKKGIHTINGSETINLPNRFIKKLTIQGETSNAEDTYLDEFYMFLNDFSFHIFYLKSLKWSPYGMSNYRYAIYLEAYNNYVGISNCIFDGKNINYSNSKGVILYYSRGLIYNTVFKNFINTTNDDSTAVDLHTSIFRFTGCTFDNNNYHILLKDGSQANNSSGNTLTNSVYADVKDSNVWF